jgi:hypothetical protein
VGRRLHPFSFHAQAGRYRYGLVRPNLSRAETAEQKVKDLDAKVVTLSRTPTAPDPEILRDRCENKRDKIELARDHGDIPKAIADKLLGWIPLEKPSVFMLSRSDDFNATPIDAILGLFKDSKLGVAVGSQTTLLSRETPGGSENKDQPISDERRKYLLSLTPDGQNILDGKASR